MVPGAAGVIDALAAIAQEGANVLGIDVLAGRRDDDHESLALERHEQLAAERVTLEHADLEWKRARLGAIDADPCAPAAKLDPRQVREVLRIARVDGERIAGALDHLA